MAIHAVRALLARLAHARQLVICTTCALALNVTYIKFRFWFSFNYVYS